MDQLEMLIEADRRGLLPPEKKAALDEALKRGIVAAPTPRAPDAIERSAAPEATMNAPSTVQLGPFDTGIPIPGAVNKKLIQLGRGFADVTEGIKQGALSVRDALTDAPPVAPAYTAEKTGEIANYERGRGPDAGIDWMRLGGNVAATAPAMLIPGGGAATLGARVASGAAQGAAASASMFTPEGESKLAQTLVGAGFGAAVPAVIAAGKRAITNLMQRATTTSGTITLPGIEAELRLQFQQEGRDFNALTREVRDSLIADAKKVLDTGGKLDPTMQMRKADIESVGAKGTRASVSRDPSDWQAQQNLRGLEGGIGDPIKQRAQEDAAALVEYLAKLRQQTGGRASTPLEAGEAVTGAFQAQDTALKHGVDTAYGAARDNLGRASPMDSAAFSKAANLALDDQMLGRFLPTEVRAILNDITLGKIPFNVNTAVQVDSVLSAAQRTAGKGSPQALAIGKVRDALNAAPIESNVGEDAKRAFDTARGMARSRFGLHEAVPAMGAAVEDVAPDRFVKKFIMDAPVRDMRAALDQLRKTPDGAQSIQDIKGHLFDTLLMKATRATNADDVTGRAFSGVMFGKALDAIPPEKLHAIFTPSELEALRTLQRASKFLTEEVPFSDVNHSKTAAAIANIVMKLGQTPLLGKIISPIIGTGKIGLDWVKNAGDRKAVAEILLSSARGNAPKAGAQRMPLPPPGKLAPFIPGAAGAVGAEASQ